MTDDGRKTETKSVQAIRGLESRTIAKWEQDGWHLVTQKPGKLRTELTFERERPPLPKKALIGAAAAVAAVAVIFTIGIVSERNDPTAAAPPSVIAPAPAPAPASSTTATSEPTTPAASEPAEPEPLTIKNSKDLAALLKSKNNCEDSVGTFAEKYEDQTIRFDGAVAAIAPHGSYKTRYDILIVPGKADTVIGPTFQYRDKNISNDFGWQGSDQPDTIGVGTELRFTARVGAYDSDTCLFQLDPVATQAR